MKKKTNKEVTVIDVPTKDIARVEAVNPYDKMIEMAITSDASMEKLEKFLELKERYEANEARKAYFKAFADFSENPPELKKDVTVSYANSDGTITTYHHADCGKSLNLIKKALSPHGLSISFDQKQENAQLTVTCYLTHRLGYQQSTTLSAAPDSSGGKNGIQGIGSSDSYLKRYTAFSITGLHAVGEDDDGVQAEPVVCIDEKQVSTLTDMLLAIDKSIEDFCIFKKVNHLEEIAASDYINCVAALKPQGAK